MYPYHHNLTTMSFMHSSILKPYRGPMEPNRHTVRISFFYQTDASPTSTAISHPI
ncbi:hypothetical protein HanIR_Chr15g0759331 [Helianthus annuus]|nr:hypothetical protein HanIR_Chr15g0759331 [Helianthus annuus]